MRCTVCKRNIAAGVDAQKMIVEYGQGDGTTKVFGFMMADGPLTAATGQLLRAYHHKHYHALRKREARGDAVTGRVLAGGPTAYEIGDVLHANGTAQYTERLALLGAVSRKVGLPVGDLTVLEAFWAEENGGPYPHTHHLRLETYQLMAHLRYAHGHTHHIGGSALATHDELHAQAALAEAQRQRLNDPGHAEPPERDWRDQAVVDI